MGVAERREREREQRRNRILDAAERTFHRDGFDSATMDAVADGAQLGKGTLYLYFRNKDELLMGVVARNQARLLENFEAAQASGGSGLARARQMLRAYAAHMVTPPERLRMAMSRWVSGIKFSSEGPCASSVNANVHALFSVMSDAILVGQRDGSVRDDVDASQLALHLWSGVNGALLLGLQRASKPELFGFARANDEQDGLTPLDAALELILDSARPRTLPAWSSPSTSREGAEREEDVA